MQLEKFKIIHMELSMKDVKWADHQRKKYTLYCGNAHLNSWLSFMSTLNFVSKKLTNYHFLTYLYLQDNLNPWSCGLYWTSCSYRRKESWGTRSLGHPPLSPRTQDSSSRSSRRPCSRTSRSKRTIFVWIRSYRYIQLKTEWRSRADG